MSINEAEVIERFIFHSNSIMQQNWTRRRQYYRQTSNISRTLVGNIIVDHSDVVGISPVSVAPTTSSFST